MIRLYVAAAVALSALAGLAWGGHALYQAGADSVRVEWSESESKRAADAALLAFDRARLLETVDHVAIDKTRSVRRAAVSAAVAGDGLRIRAQTVGATCDPGPAGSSETTPGPGAVLADVLGRLEAAGRELAATADERGIAGAACEAAFDSMR